MMDYALYPRHDVLCIDMRSFYASVEAVKLGLDPMKVMLAVVGDVSRPRSIVLAASTPLKEKYVLSNVSRFYELPHDPDIYIINANMERYLYASVEITNLLMNYAPKEAIHPSSIDEDRKSTRLNSSHVAISYAVFCLKKKKTINNTT